MDKASSSFARRILDKMQNFTNGVSKSTELDILFDEAEIFLRENDFFSAAKNYKMILNIYTKQKSPLAEFSKIHRKLGFIYREAGLYRESLDNLKKAEMLLSKIVHKNDPQLIEIQLETCETLFREDRHPEANEILEKALVAVESNSSCPSVVKFQVYERLGETRVAVRKYEEAFSLLKKALDSTLKVAEYEEEITRIFFAMGKAYSRKGNLDESLHYYKKVLQIYEKNGIRDKKLAELYEELSSIYLRKHRFEEADIALLRALNIKEELYKLSHVEIAKTYVSIALVHYYQNLFEEALKNVNSAIKMLEEFYGRFHYELVKAYRARSLIYVSTKEYKGALEEMDKAIFIMKKSHGENYVLVGEMYIDVGNIYFKMEDNKNALKKYRAGSKLLKLWRGLGHHTTADAYIRTAKTSLLLGRFSKAENKMKRVVDGLLISIESSVDDTLENFPFSRLFELKDLHDGFYSVFDHFRSKAKKVKDNLIKTEKDKHQFLKRIEYVFERNHRKSRERKKLLSWLGFEEEPRGSAVPPTEEKA